MNNSEVMNDAEGVRDVFCNLNLFAIITHQTTSVHL